MEGDAMEWKEVGRHLQAERRQWSWLALLEIDACAKALGEQCQSDIGIDYPALHLILARLAAAVGAGKCDGAYERTKSPTETQLAAVG
jgi:hypothetical protein